MFGREMRSELPELRRETVQVPREEVRDCDWSNKLKGKAYADARRGATLKSIRVGDAVLLKAEKSNKFHTSFVSDCNLASRFLNDFERTRTEVG